MICSALAKEVKEKGRGGGKPRKSVTDQRMLEQRREAL